LGPIKEVIFPFLIENEQLLTALFPPKDLFTLFSSSILILSFRN